MSCNLAFASCPRPYAVFLRHCSMCFAAFICLHVGMWPRGSQRQRDFKLQFIEVFLCAGLRGKHFPHFVLFNSHNTLTRQAALGQFSSKDTEGHGRVPDLPTVGLEQLRWGLRPHLPASGALVHKPHVLLSLWEQDW